MYTVFQFGNITYTFDSGKDRDAAILVWNNHTTQKDFEEKMSTAGIGFARKAM